MDKIDLKPGENSDENGIRIKQNSYNKDKGFWVTFKNGKKKTKLRKYIKDLASHLNKYYPDNKIYVESLIQAYDIDGISGVHDQYNVFLKSIMEEISQEIESISKNYNEFKDELGESIHKNNEMLEDLKNIREND